MMTVSQRIITILLCAFGTMLTRYLPFLIFRENQPTPRYIQYLGKALPSAVFAMLVVYCMKGTNFLSGSHGIPEILAICATILVHLWKRNMLISIAVGTICYMLLVQLVF